MGEVLVPETLTLVVAVHINEVGCVHHHTHSSLILDHEGLAMVGAKLHRQWRCVHYQVGHASRRCCSFDGTDPAKLGLLLYLSSCTGQTMIGMIGPLNA